MKKQQGVRIDARWAIAGAAAAALVVSGCGQVPQTVAADPAAVQAAVSTPEAVPSVEPSPEPEPTPVETPAALPAPAETSPQPTPTAVRKSTATATRTQTPKPTPKASPKPTQQAGPPIMQRGGSSDRIKELQARLAQIGWFSAKVTGYYGSQTTAAVTGFQAKRGLPATGAVDQTTWNRLTAMTRTPTAAELSNAPATTTPKPGSSTSQAGKSKPNVDSRCLTGRAICISKSTNTLHWIINGTVQMTMDVRFGTSEYPTREGAFSVQWKSRDHVSTIYHTSMPYALFFSGGQAVHYSPDFAARGYNGGSHGCVNLRNKSGAASLFNQARVGDKVIVYR